MFDKRRIRENGLPAQALVLSAGRHSNGRRRRPRRWLGQEFEADGITAPPGQRWTGSTR